MPDPGEGAPPPDPPASPRPTSGSTALSGADTLRSGLALALAFEAVTLAARFGAGLQSTRDTGFLAAWTFGLRIHHGYLGLVLLVLRGRLPAWRARRGATILGIGLLVSDLVHHFLVLWPLTGSPQFDLFYPPPS